MKALSIRHQLAIIVGLSLLPIALLGYLFVNQSNKEIGFAEKEAHGVDYIEAMMPDFAALAGGKSSLPDPGTLDGARGLYDEEMASAAQSADYLASRGTDALAARAGLTKLLSRVGDTSNLILDPDLDSYYVMDIIVLKLPAALNSAADLGKAFSDSVGQAQDIEAVRIDLLSRLRMFRELIDGTGASLDAAIDGNSDGGVETALVPAFADYRKVADAFSAEVETALAAYAADPGVIDTTGLTAMQAQYAEAALTFGKASDAEMTRLLERRIDGFTARLWTMLAISSVLVVLVLGVSILTSNGIVRKLGRLEGNIRRLADGNGDEDIAGTDGKDEVSAISRAIAYLRQRTIERQNEANGAKLAEQAAIDQERREAEAERISEAERKAAMAEQQARAVAILKDSLLSVAEGKLNCQIDVAFPEEMDAIRLAFNQTVVQFSKIVTQLRATSHGLKTATEEILAGTNDLSERTTKQAATIEETSAAMEQLATTVMESAKRAGSASDQASVASRTAEEGGHVMAEANQAMERISSSSAKISNIIGMIDDIAFQTNLLALNASVEAARAGEAGKGFAVVAVEVRRLAQSAAEASSEVKTLIEQSGEEVAGGTRLVAEAAEKLSAILKAVQTNATEMEAIAKDSHEQASAIDEVNVAVRQMDEMTQRNAALVEETNAAIEQTENQASELDHVVEVFTLDEVRRSQAA